MNDTSRPYLPTTTDPDQARRAKPGHDQAVGRNLRAADRLSPAVAVGLILVAPRTALLEAVLLSPRVPGSTSWTVRRPVQPHRQDVTR
jgi:hypothetical protein